MTFSTARPVLANVRRALPVLFGTQPFGPGSSWFVKFVRDRFSDTIGRVGVNGVAQSSPIAGREHWFSAWSHPKPHVTWSKPVPNSLQELMSLASTQVLSAGVQITASDE